VPGILVSLFREGKERAARRACTRVIRTTTPLRPRPTPVPGAWTWVTPKPRLPEAPWSRQTPEAGTAMVELAAYGLMIFVLLIRPGGLMGVREA
jgi:hypothetical protein